MSPEVRLPHHHIAQRLRQVTDFVNDPRAPEALAEGRVHPARAVVLKAIMATPGLPHFLYSRTYTKPYEAAGHEVLGTGYHAVVVDDGPHQVRKFYRRTAGLSEAEQRAHLAHLEQKQQSTLSHLPSFTVPQEFFIQEDPLNPNQSIIAATQARVAIKAGLNFYKGAAPLIADPSTFAAQALTMQEESTPTALPDVVGVNNLVVEAHTGEILLIDPVSLHADDPEDDVAYQQAQRILERVSSQQK